MNGAQISKIRENLGLTQLEFAQLLDVHQMTVSKWERDQASPTTYQLGLISEFETASKDKETKSKNLAAMLITAGVIAVLFFLLTKSRKGK